ncbi:MAG: DUF1593 domain-containing protein [Pirellulaceae bacterium]
MRHALQSEKGNSMKQFNLRNSSSVWLLCIIGLLTFQSAPAAEPNRSHKPRVIATTDGEVDDRSSMIRFLLYACDFDVVGIVQVNSSTRSAATATRSGLRHSSKRMNRCWRICGSTILAILTRKRYEASCESAMRLRRTFGSLRQNMKTKNTAGAQLIIDTLLDDDPRPVHVLSWGGANTRRLPCETKGQSIPRRSSTTPFLASASIAFGTKTAVAASMQNNIPAAYIYEAYGWDNVWDYESYDHARKQGKMSANPPAVQEYMKDAWLNEHVKNGHGPLGAMTPQNISAKAIRRRS